jgi:single-strand DNA-binding protein
VSANARPPASDGRELELVLLAAAAVVLGPLAFAAGIVLAAATGSSRRWLLWLSALPSAAAGLLAWRFTHRHLESALRALHGRHATSPTQVLLAAWPELWPAWLATITFAPIIAIVLSLRQGAGKFPVETRERNHPRLPRAEQRIADRAAEPQQAPTDSEGIFLGYRLAGDALLPCRRDRVFLPLSRLSHHLLVAGATGSGKTETVLRIADSLARTSDWTIVYIDGKGDAETKARFSRLMAEAGRRVWLFPDEPYDGWRGSAEEIAGRLLQLVDFADEGGGAYYRDLAVNTIRLACDTPAGPPRGSGELLGRLRRDTLLGLHPRGSAAAVEIAALRREQLDGIRARYAAFFATVAGTLEGQVALDDLDTAYFLLDGLRLKYEAGYLARFLVEEFTQWAVGRKPRSQRVLLIVDEFSAIAQAGHGLVDVVERMRGFGVAAILCPQLAEGMGSPEAAARIIGSAQTILLHAMATPEQFVHAGGTRRVYGTTRQLEGERFTGLGSTRVEQEYRVDPSDVRRLGVGQCFAIGSGLAMKLQIAAAPRPESAPTAAPRPLTDGTAAGAPPGQDSGDQLPVAPGPVGFDELAQPARSPGTARRRSSRLHRNEPARRPPGADTLEAPPGEAAERRANAPATRDRQPRKENGLNTIQLIGRLTDQPRLDTTTSGQRVCRMRLAVPGFNRDATPVFIDLEAWNTLAEACGSQLENGRRIAVTGRIGHDQWQASDGQKRQRHYVVADTVEFLDARRSGVQIEAQPELDRADG